MIENANGLRFKSELADNKMEQIKVTDSMWDELQAMPFFSCKLNLLRLLRSLCRAQGQDTPSPQAECKARLKLAQEEAFLSVRYGTAVAARGAQ